MDASMSMEFTTLSDLNPSLTLKECFKTNIFVYEHTLNRYILHLRFAMKNTETYSFLKWINDILRMAQEHVVLKDKVTMPCTAYQFMQSVVSLDMLNSFEQRMTPILIDRTRIPCVLDYCVVYDRYPEREEYFLDMGDNKPETLIHRTCADPLRIPENSEITLPVFMMKRQAFPGIGTTECEFEFEFDDVFV